MRQKRILVVDDEIDLLKVLDKELSVAGYAVFQKSDGENIETAVKDITPDLIILDIAMPDVSGLEVKDRLSREPSTSTVPVIFLTARDDVSDRIQGYKVGADDYIVKPFNKEELLARIDAVLKRRQLYEKISMTDGLTGLYNVGFFKKQIVSTFNIAKRYKNKFSLAVIDIDEFKHINDTYGHMAGDLVLKKFSLVAARTLRESDVITRYGGDEFAVIMPETDNKQAVEAVNRLKANIGAQKITLPSGRGDITFSISAGVATFDDTIKDENVLFELADAGLYEDKKNKEASADIKD